MKKSKKNNDAIIETDGTFFQDLRDMEKRILRKRGDTEALAIIEEEERKAEAEAEAEEDI